MIQAMKKGEGLQKESHFTIRTMYYKHSANLTNATDPQSQPLEPVCIRPVMVCTCSYTNKYHDTQKRQSQEQQHHTHIRGTNTTAINS